MSEAAPSLFSRRRVIGVVAVANGHDLDLYDADACLNASIETDRALQLRRPFPFLGRCRLPDLCNELQASPCDVSLVAAGTMSGLVLVRVRRTATAVLAHVTYARLDSNPELSASLRFALY